MCRNARGREQTIELPGVFDRQVNGFRGLRIRVKDILDMLAPGASHEQILADYRYLEADDIVAALQFAASQSDHPVLRGA